MRWSTLLALVGCGAVNGAALTPWREPTQVVAADFDQACEVAEDCAPVIELANCGQCGYAAAITATELDRWDRMRERRAENCTRHILPDCPQRAITVDCEDQLCVVASDEVVDF